MKEMVVEAVGESVLDRTALGTVDDRAAIPSADPTTDPNRVEFE